MIGAAICDRDWVVVRRSKRHENGDIVAAMLVSDTSGDGEATVKTFRPQATAIWLIPFNPAFEPITGDRPRSWARRRRPPPGLTRPPAPGRIRRLPAPAVTALGPAARTPSPARRRPSGPPWLTPGRREPRGRPPAWPAGMARRRRAAPTGRCGPLPAGPTARSGRFLLRRVDGAGRLALRRPLRPAPFPCEPPRPRDGPATPATGWPSVSPAAISRPPSMEGSSRKWIRCCARSFSSFVFPVPVARQRGRNQRGRQGRADSRGSGRGPAGCPPPSGMCRSPGPLLGVMRPAEPGPAP